MIHPTYHMLAPAIISTQACIRRTTPYITAAEQQASPRTLRDRRTMYSHIGQYDHTLSKKQLYQVTHSLHSEDREISAPGTIFKVKQLEDTYLNLLQSHGVSCSSHTTRFADIIINRIPELCKITKDKQVCLIFNSAIVETSEEDNPGSFFFPCIKLLLL